MPETRFAFRRRPFPATPDTSCYYPATTHERALERLLQGLRQGEGVALLTGEPGTGKTLLCHCLLERLRPDTVTAFLVNSHLNSRFDLLQAILYDLSQPYEGRSEQELRLRLTEFLLHTFASGRRTVLLVDEAQHLAPDLLEELRLLGNLEAGLGKAVQILLVAQPALLHTLQRPELAALNQRLSVRVRLAPLPLEEAVDYLLHHFRLAGVPAEQVCSEEALEILARGSQGIPRLLNQAATQALLLAEAAGLEQVDAEVALEALTSLGLENDRLPAEESMPSCCPAPAAEDSSGGEETILSVTDVPRPGSAAGPSLITCFEPPRRPA